MRARTIALALFLCAAPGAAWAADAADAPCYECHDKGPLVSGKVHPPVAEGDCESCHVDHGDQEKLILVEPVPGLCYQCHDGLTKTHRHSPVADGECLECHRVHSSPVRRLLTKAVPALCSGCHDDFSGKSVHSPVADGECAECHAPHESAQETLLTARYERDRYAEFSEEAYALCFNCHEAAAFASPEAGGATAFRQGERNLHYVHVYDREEDPEKTVRRAKKRRMSCAGCHLPHAGEQERLIRPDFRKGKMTVYTIDYKREGKGGGCVVGCHKPQEYGPESGRQTAAGETPKGSVAGQGLPAKGVN